MADLIVAGIVNTSIPDLGTNANGTYTENGTYESRIKWTRSSGGYDYTIRYETSKWIIRVEGPGTLADGTNVTNPWDVVTWTPRVTYDFSGTITVAQVAIAEPTFGLPVDVVTLITSRFGTVANFLRLRNQGQV